MQFKMDGFTRLTVIALVVSVAACGSGDLARRPSGNDGGPDGSANGGAGNGGTPGNGGSGNSAGNGGTSGSGGASSSGGTKTNGVDGGTDASTLDGSLDGSSDGSLDSSTTICAPTCGALQACVAGVCVEADVDATVGCTGPVVQPPLSATALGLPATGLALWVRGDRGVYKDSANGVCAWEDQSGNRHVLRPATERPVWENASVGKQDAIHFVSVGDVLGMGGVLGIGATAGRTFVAVDELVQTDGRFHPILQGFDGSPGEYVGIDANTWQTTGSLEGVFVADNSFDTTLATTTTPRLHVLVIPTLVYGTALPGSLLYRVNGVAQTFTLKSGSGQVDYFTDANFTAVGAVSKTPSTGITGEAFVAEALVYNRVLTTTEIANVETSLKSRYGIK
jgi:hypothetical protein